jgi:hypothetical protein
VMAGAAGAEAPEVRLPAGLALSGTVHGGRQTDRLKDVVIQIFCETTSPRCLDPTLPVAETVSTAVGDYQAVLPDPGSY